VQGPLQRALAGGAQAEHEQQALPHRRQQATAPLRSHGLCPLKHAVLRVWGGGVFVGVGGQAVQRRQPADFIEMHRWRLSACALGFDLVAQADERLAR
jgi:hypothetical protein